MTWLVVISVLFWLGAWAVNEWLSRQTFSNPVLQRSVNLAIPILFGVAILVLWEGITRGLNVPIEEGLAIERDQFARMAATNDTREALSAWIERRQPRYTGR